MLPLILVTSILIICLKNIRDFHNRRFINAYLRTLIIELNKVNKYDDGYEYNQKIIVEDKRIYLELKGKKKIILKNIKYIRQIYIKHDIYYFMSVTSGVLPGLVVVSFDLGKGSKGNYAKKKDLIDYLIKSTNADINVV
ncbi:MAG: hypothetical protein RR543_05440 [Erysipelotrichales bacterium]